ncbi:flagellar hook-length control protein FliK [Microvirga zambiensis]|uniref:flagellar hook-length control protein FliK n=1 Tax=Microvirga zambiensis TaxID=1402137 RepID=UPI001FE281AB|nr:flagellar hook-length control protein FliK [Microvirga zambiensis]
MSRLDILPQPSPRLADASSARSRSVSPDGHEGNGNSAAQGFDALLENLSGNLQKDGKTSALQDFAFPGDETDGPETNLSSDESDSLQALLSNALSDNGLGDATGLQTAGSAISVIEGLLPRILEQAGNGERVGDRQSGSSGGALNLLLSQQSGSEIDLTNPGLGARLPISVQKQETHFRPIVEGFDLAPAGPEAGGAAEPGSATNEILAHTLKAARSAGTPQSDRPSTMQAVSSNAPAPVVSEASKEAEGAQTIAVEPRKDRSETQGAQQMGSSKAEATSLPAGTLQQIAGAILDDVESLSTVQHSSMPSDGLNRVATAKASAGALRVLHLQLKPAELGLVTIKMRLAGDGLEMEIQAESEETAELLRNDAEKLSSLLRVSGYRPDAITIHSTEAAANDRSSFQRPQQGSQSQGQSFEQGAASGQGDSSRHRQDQQERGSSDIRKGSDQAHASGSSGSGGVYL